MKKILYSRLSRDRKAQFQICTSIIEEDGYKYVLKSAGCSAAKNHLQSFERNCKILNEIFGDKINIVNCDMVDESTAKFEYVEGRTLTEAVVELYRANEMKRAADYIVRLFEIISSGSTEDFKPCKQFCDVFGDFNYPKPLKGIGSSSFEMHLNNVVIDEHGEYNYFDYEWEFGCLIPVNYIVFRSMRMLLQTGVFADDFFVQFREMFGIDNEQIETFQKMEFAFLSYARSASKPNTIFDYHNLLGNKNVVHNLNWLDINNPKVFPDYGNGYSEYTKKICTDFDFRNGRLDTRVAFEKAPERIRFDPADLLYCAVSDIKVMANGKELSISWHNGSDLNGVMLFDTIDSNIYYENPERSREFTISANIFGFSDEMLLKALKDAQGINAEHMCLQRQYGELQELSLQNQEQLRQTQEQLRQTQEKLDTVEYQLNEEKKSLIEARTSAEQWREAYTIISNSGFWKITYPLRKLFDIVKSIFKKH